MPQNHDLLDLALTAARRAAGYIRAAAPPDPGTWDRKAKSDFVTAIDRGAERLIAETLSAGSPNSTIIGEELSPAPAGADLAWVVDPLDGTTNFLHRYPAYAVSIAAVRDAAPVAGVVLDVSRDLAYTAVAGHGAWCGADRLRVSSVSDPTLALLGTGFPFKRPASNRLDQYLRQFAHLLRRTAGIRRAGSAALDLADVAAGRFDGFWELWLAPWDVAAGLLLVREAGGVVTDLAGSHATVTAGSFVAGNPAVHAWLVETLAEAG